MITDPLAASPLFYTAMLAGPAIAGITMTGVAQGRAGLRRLLSRLVRWRVGMRWFAARIVGVQPEIVAPVHGIGFNLPFEAIMRAIVGVLAVGGIFSQRAAPRPALERG
jgi:hypothetical protein